MYKRKFPKTKTLVGNISTSTRKENISSLSMEAPTLSTISRNYSIDECPTSPSLLDDLPELPVEKKRKIADNVLDNTEPPLNNDPFSYLTQILASCGLHLKNDQNVLSVEEYKFIQSLKSKLTTDSEDIAEFDLLNKFVTVLEAYLNDKINLKVALSPCKAMPENKLRQQRDSLARLLLQVPIIQPNLIDILFDKMVEICLEDVTDSIMTTQKWVRLLLKPFKQLYSIIDLRKVCSKLFDNLTAVSDDDLKRELIASIPDIVLDSEEHDAHDELCKLLRDNKQLMACILETIGLLTIAKEDLTFIQMDMIPEISHTPLDILPALVRFLIKVDDLTVAEKIVDGLRSELPFANLDKFSQLTANSENFTSIQLVIFSCIYDRFLSSKLLLDVWVKTISQVQSHVEHKPMDVVILFLAYSSASNDSSTMNSILSVFKDRLKNGFFRTDIMEKTFKIFTPVFKEYFESFIKMFSNLVKVTDHVSIEVVSSMAVNCFNNIDQCWCNWIVEELLVLMGTGNKLIVEVVLNILSEFTEQRINKMQPLATRLTSVFMNKIYDFSIREISQVMDMLCKIAYSEGPDGINDCSVFQDEINIFVQKELCSIDTISQRVGIIGAIMLIKHIVSVTPEEASETISNSEEDIPLTPKAKEAYSLIELLLTRTKADTDFQILFFDQFAHMLFQCPYLDKTFMHTVSTVLKTNFQYSFLIAANEFLNENLMFDCSLTFCLDKKLDEIIAVNICPVVMNETNKVEKAVLGFQSSRSNALTSMFRLVRVLEREDLSEIDALLGCPIILPNTQTMDNFEMLSPEQQIVVVNTLFHTVNWFHEVINCFSYLIKQKNGSKVLIRLRTITYLIKSLKKCLSVMYDPEYIPPVCYYGLAVEKPNFNKIKNKSKTTKSTKGDKKAKGKVNISVNTTSATNFNITHTSHDDNNFEDEVDISIYKDYFRELDIDTWLILTQKFVINPDSEKDKEFSPELGPSELRYLLEDILQKLEHVVFKNKKISPLAKSKSKETVGFTTVSMVPEKTMLKNFIKLLPHIFTDLEALSEFFKNLLIVNDNILDATGMFMVESIELKQCVGLILKSIVVLFQWSDFKSSDTEDLFINALRKMISRTDLCSQSTQSRRQMCKKELLSEKIKYLGNYQDIILHIDAAVSLVTVMKLLNNFSYDLENDVLIRDTCWNFLTRQWYTMQGSHEDGTKYNEKIKFLLNTYFQCHDNVSQLTKLVEIFAEEVLVMESKTDKLKTLPTINKANLKLLISVILSILLDFVKKGLKKSESEYDRLTVWQSSIFIMEKVVCVVKKQDSRNNLLAFVKNVLHFLGF
ncbi:Fanconi anemia group D2 protein isoform X2 [Adelges cooleyi]|uniref:Fanconi anemia group D2 protein isoform X2 n=1 Tax=Adelges cooleyi TaxID=133065 RepID=UPI00218073B7|nr:Fanconi anemia group D2 protein isoform X2 [Adelges cooleyi]